MRALIPAQNTRWNAADRQRRDQDPWATHVMNLVKSYRLHGYTSDTVPENWTAREREAVCLYLIEHPRRTGQR